MVKKMSCNVIGEGSYGLVVNTNGQYACKVFLEQDDDPQRDDLRMKHLHAPTYLKEIDPSVLIELNALKLLEACSQVVHAGSVDYVNIHGLKDSRMAYSMPLAMCDLSNLGRLSVPECAQMLYDTASALAYAHNAGIMHCDIKPQNILVFMRDGKKTFKLADFGIAQFDFTDVYASKERNTDVVTIQYRAPELCAQTSKYSAKVDVFSLGVVLLEALTNQALIVNGSTDSEVYTFWSRAFDMEESTLGNLRDSKPCPQESMPHTQMCRRMFFRGRCPAGVGKDGIDLLMHMLHPDPAKRCTAEDVLRHPFLAHFEPPPKPMAVDQDPSALSTNLTRKNTSVEHAIEYSKALGWISAMDGGPNGPFGAHAASVLYRFLSTVDVDVKSVLKYAYVCFCLVQKAFYAPDATLEYFCPEDSRKFEPALKLLINLELEVARALEFKILQHDLKLL